MTIEISVDRVQHDDTGEVQYGSSSNNHINGTNTLKRKRKRCYTSIGQVFQAEIALIKLCGGLLFDGKFSKYFGIAYKLALIGLTRWFMGGSYIVYTNNASESKASMQNIKFFWAFNDFAGVCALGATFVSSIRYHKLIKILLSKRFDRGYLTEPKVTARLCQPTPSGAGAGLLNVGVGRGAAGESLATRRAVHHQRPLQRGGVGGEDDDTGSTSELLRAKPSSSDITTLTSASGSSSSGLDSLINFTPSSSTAATQRPEQEGGAYSGSGSGRKGRPLFGAVFAKSKSDPYKDTVIVNDRISKVKLARILMIVYVLLASTTAVVRVEYKRLCSLELQQKAATANNSTGSSANQTGSKQLLVERVDRRKETQSPLSTANLTATSGIDLSKDTESAHYQTNSIDNIPVLTPPSVAPLQQPAPPHYSYGDFLEWLVERIMTGSVKLVHLLPMFCFYTCHVLLNISQLYGQSVVTLQVTAVLTDMLRRAGEQENVHERNYRALLDRRQAREHAKLLAADDDRSSSLIGADYDYDLDDYDDDGDYDDDVGQKQGGPHLAKMRPVAAADRRRSKLELLTYASQDNTVLQTTQLLIQVRDVLIALRSAVSLNFLFLQMLDMSHLMGVLSYFTSYIATNQYDWVALLCFDYLRLVFGVLLSRIGYHWLHDEARKISLINERRLIESALNSYSSNTSNSAGKQSSGASAQQPYGSTVSRATASLSSLTYNQTTASTLSSSQSPLTSSHTVILSSTSSSSFKRGHAKEAQGGRGSGGSGGLSDTSSGGSGGGGGGGQCYTNRLQLDQVTRVEATTNYRLAKEIEHLWPTDWYTPDLKSYVAQNFFVITFVATLQQLVEASAKVEFQAQHHGLAGAGSNSPSTSSPLAASSST